MKMTFRWFGPEADPIPLAHIRQIPGVHGVVGTLYHKAAGEVWEQDEIDALVARANAADLGLEVIESVNVHESIKLGTSGRDQCIDNYILTLSRLAKAGVRVVCYNFMPIFDWFRTELAHELPDGSRVLRYNEAEVRVLDPASVMRKIESESQGFVLPGWEKERLAGLKELFAAYEGLDATRLLANLGYFIDALVPTLEAHDISMAIHPDDPPWGIFGLPRIVGSQVQLDAILALNPSPHHGLTLCSGSLGANPDNDIPALIRRYKGRIHFAHVRNVKHESKGMFHESSHLSSDGSLDMYEIMRAYHETGFDGYVRPDHGRMIWDEKGRPGYGLYDRALGIAYLNGLWEAINKNASKGSER